MTIVQRASKFWCQLVLINVPKKVCDRTQQHHLKVRTKRDMLQSTLCTLYKRHEVYVSLLIIIYNM